MIISIRNMLDGNFVQPFCWKRVDRSIGLSQILQFFQHRVDSCVCYGSDKDYLGRQYIEVSLTTRITGIQAEKSEQ